MVGYTLRQERERQNLSVNDIEQGTSIRALYIEAIENGEYDKLPGEIYTKGFIKNYAKFLGMDADSVVKEFLNDMAELKAETEVANQVSEEQVQEVKPVKPEKKPLGSFVHDRNRSSSGLLIVAAVVVIAALAGFAWSWLSSSDGDIAKADPPQKQVQSIEPENVTQTPVQPEPAEPIQAEPEQPVATEQPAAVKSDSVNIQARFNNRCWTLVTVDGTVVQEGIVEGGQTLSWEGKENITFRLGNAGAVEFFQDGKSLGVPGAEGDIVDKTFTKN